MPNKNVKQLFFEKEKSTYFEVKDSKLELIACFYLKFLFQHWK